MATNKVTNKESPAQKKPRGKDIRIDGVLSPEDLEKAIAEFKVRRAQRMAAKDAEGDPAPETAPAPEVDPPVKDGEEPVIAPAGETPEDKLQQVKDNRDRRDNEGDPGDKNAALGIIAQQDGDIDILFDIIDTLLAERDFKAASDGEGCENNDEGEPEGNTDPVTPAQEENSDGDDDDIPNATPADVPSTMNADSIDTIVRQRIQLGMIGQTLNMDGLESMPIMAAKKAVIQAVRPGIRLDGKSVAYIDAAFDCAVADARTMTRKDTSYQRRQIFNRDSAQPMADGQSASARRQAMIDRQHKKEEK